jgi:hypothetical protein
MMDVTVYYDPCYLHFFCCELAFCRALAPPLNIKDLVRWLE